MDLFLRSAPWEGVAFTAGEPSPAEALEHELLEETGRVSLGQRKGSAITWFGSSPCYG